MPGKLCPSWYPCCCWMYTRTSTSSFLRSFKLIRFHRPSQLYPNFYTQIHRLPFSKTCVFLPLRLMKSRKVRILSSQVLTSDRLLCQKLEGNQYPGNLEMCLQHSKIWRVLTDFKFHNIPVIIDEAHYTGNSPPIQTTIIKKTCLIGTDADKTRSLQGRAAWTSAAFLVSWRTSFCYDDLLWGLASEKITRAANNLSKFQVLQFRLQSQLQLQQRIIEHVQQSQFERTLCDLGRFSAQIFLTSLCPLPMTIFSQTILNKVVALGPAAVNLGTAGNFAILAKSSVSTVPPSAVGM